MLVTRTGGDNGPRASGPFVRPIIFSQTEIEAVGLEAHGRLSLLDTFISGRRDTDGEEEATRAGVRSLTVEAETLRRDIEELTQQVAEIPALDKQISDLSPMEKELAAVSADANEKKTRLDTLSSGIAAAAVGVGAMERFHEAISRWQSSVAAASLLAPAVEPWPAVAGADPLANSRASIERVQGYLRKAEEELALALQEARARLQSSHDEKLKLEDRARQLRKEIDTLQQGAGAIVRQGQQLRETRAQLRALVVVLTERQKALQNLLARRGAALDELDKIRERRFSARHHVAAQLSETLGPRIRVSATRAGQFESFAAAIADALRGSGLRYNELSSMLAENISPREVLEAADTNDVNLLMHATGITKDRAVRTLSHLRESDLGSLATVAVEDAVSLELLDGTIYKGIGALSTGQRCTVVLPLVLRHIDHILIVDQPEDHIDNAFIADTLVLALLARGPGSQVIFSTHNANIPVLGNADRVVQLDSDGKRGFPVLASELAHPGVVAAITNVMEGGKEAFKRRAAFYEEYSMS